MYSRVRLAPLVAAAAAVVAGPAHGPSTRLVAISASRSHPLAKSHLTCSDLIKSIYARV